MNREARRDRSTYRVIDRFSIRGMLDRLSIDRLPSQLYAMSEPFRSDYGRISPEDQLLNHIEQDSIQVRRFNSSFFIDLNNSIIRNLERLSRYIRGRHNVRVTIEIIEEVR